MIDLVSDIEKYLDENRVEIKKVISSYYNKKKKELETVTLKDRNDQSKNITKQITTNLSFLDNDKNFLVEVKSESDIENKIFRAQQTGTAVSVGKDILEYFEIKTEDITKELMESKYFDPKGQIESFYNDVKTLLDANKDIR